MARSRAGLIFTIIALFAAFAFGFSTRRVGSRSTFNKLLLGAVAVAATFAGQFALYRIMERFSVDSLQVSRSIFAHNTIEAARAYMPIGSGLGTFVPVYGMFEKPEDTVADAYVNHAHNDALELWLDTGAVGLVLMGIFVAWFVLRSVKIWRGDPPLGAREIDWALARAGTLVVALVVAHSFVDYPLRTGAMMAIMAFACALLIEPSAAAEGVLEPNALRPRASRGTRRLEPVPAPAFSTRRTAPVPSAEPSGVQAHAQDALWDAGIQWPEEWRKSSPEPPDGDQTTKPLKRDP
jgi:O-antigen ligase